MFFFRIFIIFIESFEKIKKKSKSSVAKYNFKLQKFKTLCGI